MWVFSLVGFMSFNKPVKLVSLMKLANTVKLVKVVIAQREVMPINSCGDQDC